MKNFLDPIANAKTAAFFLIVIGVIGILQYPALLLNPATYSQPVFFLFGFLAFWRNRGVIRFCFFVVFLVEGILAQKE